MATVNKRCKSKKLKTPVTKQACDMRFTLKIKTTNTSPQHGMLLNRFEEPDSRIISIRPVDIGYYDEEADEFVTYTKEELKSMPGYAADTMTFENTWTNDETNEITGFTTKTFKKDGGFSCWDVINNIVKFEKLDRPKSEWFGGVDCHHVFYEGIYFNKKTNKVSVFWGS